MNKLDEYLELNDLTEIYTKNWNKDKIQIQDGVDDEKLLLCSFYWEDTEEGYLFWSSVNDDYLNWLYEEQGKLETLR